MLLETCVTAEDPEYRKSLVQKELQANVLSIFPTGKLSFIFVCVMKLPRHKIHLLEKKIILFMLRWVSDAAGGFSPVAAHGLWLHYATLGVRCCGWALSSRGAWAPAAALPLGAGPRL